VATFLILGAGRQAKAAAVFLLKRFDQARVIFVDVDEANLQTASGAQPDHARVECHRLSVVPITDQLRGLVKQSACVVSGVPFFFNEALTRLAIECARPFCDLGGNKGTVLNQLALADAARAAGVAVVPDCGLAPGSLNVLAEYWRNEWTYRGVKLYCGGLPQHPQGTLKYTLTFSPWGLFNEYFDDCEVARGGKVQTVPGLSELETLTDLPLPGTFEAFMTSGGASIGPRVYAPHGVDYQYKTLRYPGHRDIMEACRQMGLFNFAKREFRIAGTTITAAPADLNGQVLEAAIPSDGQDLVVARAVVEGLKNGMPVRGRIDLLDYAAHGLTAMERTTGFGVAIVAAALAGLYPRNPIAPGAHVPFQVLDPKLLIEELAAGGITGITVRTF
jgi:lysine 6-dehydrogenase